MAEKNGSLNGKAKEVLTESLYTELKEKKELTDKQILFIAEYLTNGLKQTRAYLKIYHNSDESKYNNAHSRAHELVQNSAIKSAIRKVLDSWIGSKELKLKYEIIDQLYTIVFFDPFMFITKAGTPSFEDIKDIPKKYRCCIEGITYSKKNGMDIKLADRSKARAELSKYIVLYKDTLDVSHSMTEETELMLKGMLRKAHPTKKDKK